MPTRPAVPAPRPLSARAVRYIADTAQDAEERRAAVAKAFAAGEANARALTKAKPKSDQIAVYDADGNLVGITDPDAITPIAAAEPAEKPKPAAPPADPNAAPAAPPAPAAAEVAKARADQAIAQLRKSLTGGGSTGTAGEAAQAAETLNRALISRFTEMQRHGLAPGAPRRG